MTQSQTIDIPLGEFPLATHVASHADLLAAYQDDREITVGFSGMHINSNYRVKAVFRINDLDGLRGHTTEPSGFNLRVFGKSDSPFVEITLRKGV